MLIEVSSGQENERRQLAVRTIDLAQLAASGGVEHIGLTSDRRQAYTVEGYIHNTTDAAAQSLAIQISVEALLTANAHSTSKNAMARVARLAGLELPSFAHPTSQTWSAEQMREPAFRSACKILSLSADVDSWPIAYVYHATRYLVGALAGTRGFGAGLSAEAIAEAFVAGEADAIAHWTLDPAHWPPADDLDFAWLIFEAPIIPAGHLFWMINLLLDRLSPGGVLVVVFTLEHSRLPQDKCDVLKRGDVETFALRLLAQGHGVAQLKFRAADRPLPAGRRTSFGLLVRRAA
jgi:hypothetical protein